MAINIAKFIYGNNPYLVICSGSKKVYHFGRLDRHHSTQNGINLHFAIKLFVEVIKSKSKRVKNRGIIGVNKTRTLLDGADKLKPSYLKTSISTRILQGRGQKAVDS